MAEKQRMVHEAGGSEQPPVPPTKAKKTLTTLGELGFKLPVGAHRGGTLVKDLAMRPWRTREERELGRMKKPKMGFAQYVSMILCYMCTRFADSDWSEAPDLNDKRSKTVDERRVQLGRMYMGDILHAYVLLRREALGPELVTNITCTSCNHAFKFDGDLNSVEVGVVDSPEALEWNYKLITPVKIRGKDVASFRMSAPLWAPIEAVSATNTMNEAVGKITALRASIVGLNDDPSPILLTDTEMDDLTKRDLEALATQVDDNFVGPNMSLEGECPSCDAPFRSQINWRYEDFFSISSR